MVFSWAFLVGLENTVFKPDGELPGPVHGVVVFFWDADSGLFSFFSCLVVFTELKDGMSILFTSVSEDFHFFFPSLSVTVFLQVCFN